MASRQFTVDSAKKREFINIFLLMPETRVDDAMRKAEFTEKDIADLLLRRSLQRALPGGSITGLQDYIARQRKQPPPHLPVDPAATDAAATVPPPEEIVIDAEATTVLSSLSPGTATKRKKDRKRWNRTVYQNKKNKMIGLFSLPAVMTTRTTQMTTTQTRTTTQTTTKTTTTQTMTTMTAVCPDHDHWTLNSNGTMRTPLAQRIAKCRQVKPAVDIILRADNTVRQGALLRGVLDHPSWWSAMTMRLTPWTMYPLCRTTR